MSSDFEGPTTIIAAAHTLAAGESQSTPPLTYIFPLIAQIASTAFSAGLVVSRAGFSIVKALLHHVWSLIALFIPVFSYIFSPVTVLAVVVFNVFVSMPYRLAGAVIEAFYPIYILFGTAIISASLVAVVGCAMVSFLRTVVLGAGPAMYTIPSSVSTGKTRKNAPVNSKKQVRILEAPIY